MTPAQTISQTISLYHPLLSNIAFKMLGTLADAEDIVQDTYLKWLSIDQSKIKNTKAYLIKAVTNNCLNHLNSLKAKKEEYLEHFNLADMIDARIDLDLTKLDLGIDVASALQVVHKKLEPLERAVFILREVFDYDYEDLHLLFDKKKDNCRQIYCRAKDKLNRKTLDLKPDIGLPHNFLKQFKEACSIGVPADFMDTLKKEISCKLHLLPKRQS